MGSRWFGAAAVAAALVPATVGAREAAPADPVTVVASRTPTLLSEVGQSVTVLDVDDIRTSQALSVAELIQTTPGVALARTGGPGQPTSIFIRGADSDHTLVLIDGVAMEDATQPSGDFDFANLMIGDTYRIEILRGAHSTLWGSQAIGGVVDIETTPPSAALAGQASAEGGAFGTQDYRAALGGALGPVFLRAGAAYFITDGIPAFDVHRGGSGANGYRNTGFTARLDAPLGGAASLDVRAGYTSAWVSFDGYDTPTGQFGFDGEFAKSVQYLGYAGVRFPAFGGALKNLMSVQYVDTDRRNFDPQLAPQETYYGFGGTLTFAYQGALTIGKGLGVVAGLEQKRATLATDTPAYDTALSPVRAHASQASAYADLKVEPWPGLDLETGLRFDHHQAYGDHVTGQASGVRSLNGGATRLRASFGQGFKAPALYQLYSPYGPFAQRLPTLRPEQSNSWDLGVEQQLLGRTLTASATFFGRVSRDLITFIGSPGVYANVGRASAQGLEVQAQWRPEPRLLIAGNYTFDRARDLTGHAPLILRPEHAANLSADYVWPVGLSTGLAARYAGAVHDVAYDADYNQVPVLLRPYVVVQLRAAWPLTAKIEAFGRIENLFNQHYETAYPYGAPGIGGFFGLRAKL